MIDKLQKFIRLSGTEKIIMLEAIYTICLVKIALKFMSFRQVLKLFSRSSSLVNKGDVDEATVRHITESVNRVANSLTNTLCLPRALAVQKMLDRRQYSSQLHIGTTRDVQGNFQAHAWIEQSGKVIIGELDDLNAFSTF